MSVIVKKKTPVNITSNTFWNYDATLYVPYGFKTAYEAADNWNKFNEIVEMDPSPIITFKDANVKDLCVKSWGGNWDINCDGQLSEEEADVVTSIGTVFSGKQNISSFDELQYFTALNSIEANAFFGCKGLTSIIIPHGVTTIGEQAFEYCRNLSVLNIPNSVISIDKYAMSNCTGLSSITIGNRVTSIGVAAFNGCSSLTSIIIPKRVSSIGYNLFSGCI
jgi:hypothetical protein